LQRDIKALGQIFDDHAALAFCDVQDRSLSEIKRHLRPPSGWNTNNFEHSATPVKVIFWCCEAKYLQHPDGYFYINTVFSVICGANLQMCENDRL
jgi:hypothetical protein